MFVITTLLVYFININTEWDLYQEILRYITFRVAGIWTTAPKNAFKRSRRPVGKRDRETAGLPGRCFTILFGRIKQKNAFISDNLLRDPSNFCFQPKNVIITHYAEIYRKHGESVTVQKDKRDRRAKSLFIYMFLLIMSYLIDPLH